MERAEEEWRKNGGRMEEEAIGSSSTQSSAGRTQSLQLGDHSAPLSAEIGNKVQCARDLCICGRVRVVCECVCVVCVSVCVVCVSVSVVCVSVCALNGGVCTMGSLCLQFM